MKRLWPIIFAAVFATALLTGCAMQKSIQPAKQELTPIEQLDETEKLIFDSLLIGFEVMYDPVSVKVLEMGEVFQVTTSKYINIKLQGTNEYGGKVTDSFMLVLAVDEIGAELGIKQGRMSVNEYGIKEPCDTARVGRINRALAYHWESLGLN